MSCTEFINLSACKFSAHTSRHTSGTAGNTTSCCHRWVFVIYKFTQSTYFQKIFLRFYKQITGKCRHNLACSFCRQNRHCWRISLNHAFILYWNVMPRDMHFYGFKCQRYRSSGQFWHNNNSRCFGCILLNGSGLTLTISWLKRNLCLASSTTMVLMWHNIVSMQVRVWEPFVRSCLQSMDMNAWPLLAWRRKAMGLLLGAFFVLNISYPSGCPLTMEFFQR